MAKISFSSSNKYGTVLGYFEYQMLDDHALRRVVRRGAAVVADAVRQAMDTLPTRKRGSEFHASLTFAEGLTQREKNLLQKHFGVSPIKRDRDGFLHAKIGWDGYAGHGKRGFPHGFPVVMIARMVESGTSWRVKLPFVRPVVNRVRKAAVAEMQKAMDEELDDIFNFEGRT